MHPVREIEIPAGRHTDLVGRAIGGTHGGIEARGVYRGAKAARNNSLRAGLKSGSLRSSVPQISRLIA